MFVPTSEKKQWPVAPTGVHNAVCVDVHDRGMVPGWEGEPTHKVLFIWQLEARDDDGAPHQVAASYKVSLHEKSNLSRMLEAWRGHQLTDDERGAGGFDLEDMIGRGCQLNITHYVKNDGTMGAKVNAIMPLNADADVLPIENYTRIQDKPS